MSEFGMNHPGDYYHDNPAVNALRLLANAHNTEYCGTNPWLCVIPPEMEGGDGYVVNLDCLEPDLVDHFNDGGIDVDDLNGGWLFYIHGKTNTLYIFSEGTYKIDEHETEKAALDFCKEFGLHFRWEDDADFIRDDLQSLTQLPESIQSDSLPENLRGMRAAKISFNKDLISDPAIIQFSQSGLGIEPLESRAFDTYTDAVQWCEENDVKIFDRMKDADRWQRDRDYLARSAIHD